MHQALETIRWYIAHTGNLKGEAAVELRAAFEQFDADFQTVRDAALRLPPYNANPLSPREMEMIQLVANGLENPQLQERLTISLNTIRVHWGSILYKLQAHNRAHAVAIAVKHGWLDVSDVQPWEGTLEEVE